MELLRSAEYIRIVQQHLYNTTAVVLASEFCPAFIYMALSVGVGAMGKYSNKLCFGTLKCFTINMLFSMLKS